MPCARCQRTLPSDSAFCPHCGQTVGVAVEADELLGAFIAGRYRITSVIGQGGMGRVYLADQTMGDATRRVAIKVLLPQFAADAKAASRFLRECATTGALDDPHTVRVYDCGQLPDGRLYIAMEYVDGRSLAALLEEEGPLAPARVVELLGQVCESLEEAHGKRIVHRDLKPENIMIVPRPGGGELVKVLDFGIAKAIDEPGHAAVPVITSAGAIVGSPPYMSPEQFVAGELDARADVYALGVIGYEMLTGGPGHSKRGAC
jgi:serine/threonine protein kinase